MVLSTICLSCVYVCVRSFLDTTVRRLGGAVEGDFVGRCLAFQACYCGSWQFLGQGGHYEETINHSRPGTSRLDSYE